MGNHVGKSTAFFASSLETFRAFVPRTRFAGCETPSIDSSRRGASDNRFGFNGDDFFCFLNAGFDELFDADDELFDADDELFDADDELFDALLDDFNCGAERSGTSEARSRRFRERFVPTMFVPESTNEDSRRETRALGP